MSVFLAMLLGLIQGATIFLPVSNSGHQAILQNIFQLDPSQYDNGVYNLFMSLSTLVSIMMAYRKELMTMLSESADFLRGRSSDDALVEGRMSPSIRMIFFIVIGTLPMLLSIPITQRVEILNANTIFIGCAMIATGAVLYASDRFIVTGRKNEKKMSTMDAVLIGIAQAVSVIPGLSRIGNTTVVGMTRGLGKEFSVRFAIFLSLPSIIITILSSFFSVFRSGTDWESFFSYLVAFIVSVLTGYFALQMFRVLTGKRRLRYAGYYSAGIGALTVILSLILQR